MAEVKSHEERAIELLYAERAIGRSAEDTTVSVLQGLRNWEKRRDELLAEVDRAKQMEDAVNEREQARLDFEKAAARLNELTAKVFNLSRERAHHS